ncbi:Flagellum-specific ATP synthase [Andreprevotia sp. IGB-42]|uniref:FliI/YscN family ATPase n=1 Tax=Andreprevotia sp. IGB-42 TaxID=2497473 RepID=UPI00135BA5F8|nr:FliI/YscN family ATPase [Andreprevotia sp. IGB-42]KAF0813394.1 Flagellum-specific ATP synthase [Andreprevotia sp. IGB-42]
MTSVYLECLRTLDTCRRLGAVTRLAGLSIEARGPDAPVGEVCEIVSRHDGRRIRAEVVGLNDDRLILMPYGDTRGIAVGSEVLATGHLPEIGVGDALLGRVIDAFGAPIDDLAPPAVSESRPLRTQPVNPLRRPRIEHVMETGVRAIDSILTLGQGQRIGIFAGSGVGKSTLLGMIAKHIVADVNVIALIGERGREVKEFIEQQLGPEGLARSVVVVATADMPALARARAAYAATAIAEYFRDQGKQVMLTMDSVTRFAMAKREIGLAAGEPPTARGYTPSVFTELPELCERCGTSDSGGSITALYTVLVEGDDFNEPISDILRATLDGHIVLSRKLAQSGHFPAIDILQSASRLLPDLAAADELKLVHEVVAYLASYERNREMIDIGAYRTGSNAEIDRAVGVMPALRRFLCQGKLEHAPRQAVLAQLRHALGVTST